MRHLNQNKRGERVRGGQTPGVAGACSRISVLVVLALLHSPLHAAKVDVDRDGDLEAGVGFFTRGFWQKGKDNQIYNEEPITILGMQLDYTVRVHPRIAGSFDIHGDIAELGLELRKAYVEIDFARHVRFRSGNMEKNLSLEELFGRSELKTIERSLLHDYLQSLHVAGYDLGFELHCKHWERDARQIQSWALGGVQGARRIYGNLMAGADFAWGRLLTSAIVAYDPHQAHFLIGGASLLFRQGAWHLEAESFGGKDPLSSDLLDRLGEQRAVYFGAIRALGAYAAAVSTEMVRAIEPVASAALVLQDISDRPDPLFEAQAGVNLLFDTEATVRWMTHGAVRFARGATNWIGRESIALYSQMQLSW